MPPAEPGSRDLLAGRRGRLAFLGPQAVFVAGFFVPPAWRTAVWPAALGALGAACLYNARRCGRLHCHLTGPFYLAAAIVSLAYGLGVLAPVRGGWLAIGIGTVAVGNLLAVLPERRWGRYRRAG